MIPNGYWSSSQLTNSPPRKARDTCMNIQKTPDPTNQHKDPNCTNQSHLAPADLNWSCPPQPTNQYQDPNCTNQHPGKPLATDTTRFGREHRRHCSCKPASMNSSSDFSNSSPLDSTGGMEAAAQPFVVTQSAKLIITSRSTEFLSNRKFR